MNEERLMGLNQLTMWAASVALVCVVGCGGGVQIATPKHVEGDHAALGEGKISSVTVTSSGELQGDKQELISKNDVPNKLQGALTDSLKAANHADPAGALKMT